MPQKNKLKRKVSSNLNPKKVEWESKETTAEPLCTTCTLLTVFAVLLLILMVDLYFFVDSPQPEIPEAAPQPKRNYTRPKRPPTFQVTQLATAEELQGLISEENRIVVVAFEEATAEGNKQRFWKRWERIAKQIPVRAQFKRLDDEEKPKVVRFDCSGPAKATCEQILGNFELPIAIFWKNNIPRFFPAEVRTDKQIYNYLAKQMEEAVKYLETAEEAKAFTEEEGLILMYFGADKELVYHSVADVMRDHAIFGRTRDEEIVEEFGVEVPSLHLYRGFDESPYAYTGNITDQGAIIGWIRENSVPKFGEWTPNTAKLYQQSKKPMMFVFVDSTESETENILKVGRTLADEFWSEFSMTHLDIIMNREVAKQMGVQKAPEILIYSGKEGKDARQEIDLDNIESSFRKAVADWEAASTVDANEFTDEYDDEEYDIDENYEDEEEEDGEGETQEEDEDIDEKQDL